MKKYKKSIEISYANIEEVLNVPIVDGIEKRQYGNHVEGYSYAYFTWSVNMLNVQGYELPFGIGDGSVLALDVCDNWHAFSKEQWKNHKDDEIKDKEE